MNKVLISGNLVSDCEYKQSQSGITYVRGTLANNDIYKKEKSTLYIDFIMFSSLAESLKAYLKKGVKLLIDGKLQQESYIAKDGTKRTKYSLICEKVEIFSFVKDTSEPTKKYSQSDKYEQISNDEIPF